MLTEIRDGLQQVGKKFEPTESDFHLEQLRTIEELRTMEVNLQDEEKKKILVMKSTSQKQLTACDKKPCIGNNKLVLACFSKPTNVNVTVLKVLKQLFNVIFVLYVGVQNFQNWRLKC